MKLLQSNNIIYAACFLTLATTLHLRVASAADFAAAAEVIRSRCLSCHNSETREAGIDLTPLLDQENSSYGDFTALWIKADRMVARGKMPPADEEPLEAADKESITNWFRQSFVLRNGRAHIGPAPLRRLTRSELENTLQDVLAIRLKAPYRDTITGQIEPSVIESLLPSDIPGKSGFNNDAHRLESLRPPLQQIADAAHYALSVFSSDSAAVQAVLGRRELPTNATDDEVGQLISTFVMRVCRCSHARAKELQDAYFRRYLQHPEGSRDVKERLLQIFEMILVSPDFLYRLEESRGLDTPYPVNGVELATRLSYFLWSTGPDAELLRLGRDDSLLTDEVLQAQIARMLNSPEKTGPFREFCRTVAGASLSCCRTVTTSKTRGGTAKPTTKSCSSAMNWSDLTEAFLKLFRATGCIGVPQHSTTSRTATPASSRSHLRRLTRMCCPTDEVQVTTNRSGMTRLCLCKQRMTVRAVSSPVPPSCG